MLDWIRQRRTWIATFLLVALLPFTAVMGQSLVWCFGADGHSGIEAPHQPHAAREPNNIASVGAELCTDIVWNAPTTVLGSTPTQPPVPACWFGGKLSLTLTEGDEKQSDQPSKAIRHENLPHQLEHLRTVILRV